MSGKEEIKDLFYDPGLRRTITGGTKICLLDENIDPPMFFYYGYSIADLAKYSNFEEVAYLLFHGELPTREELILFNKELISDLDGLRYSGIISHTYRLLELHSRSVHPMDILRTLVSVFGANDLEFNKENDDLKRATRLAGIMPFFVASVGCYTKQRYPRTDKTSFSQPKNFLYFLNSGEPYELDIKLIDTSCILYAEHEFNVSTTTDHAITSANSDIYSAICGAIGALRGNLHGGANEAAMNLLLEIGNVNRVEECIMRKLARKEKIMGFGHGVYKKGDPRCPIMKPLVLELSLAKGEMKWFEISEKVEELILREKGLYPNIDFWTAPAYYLLDIPIRLYTPLFVMSRVVGWCAHFMEYKNLKQPLMRPRAKYIGPKPRPYILIRERG